MKKALSLAAMTLIQAMAFAQATGAENTATQPSGELLQVKSLFLFFCIGMVSLFAFIIIYSLSKAVRVLSEQVTTKK